MLVDFVGKGLIHDGRDSILRRNFRHSDGKTQITQFTWVMVSLNEDLDAFGKLKIGSLKCCGLKSFRIF